MKNQYRETALGQGIQFIGIGKHGSKDLPETLVREILRELQSGKANALQMGVFFGALVTKGVAPHEYQLEEYLGKGTLSDPAKLYQSICADAPYFLKEIGVKILNKIDLNIKESKELGDFLLSNLPGESYRGMAVSVLRIRYETDEEYRGLIRAVEATYSAGFRNPVSLPEPLVQLAEPFDGVEHSYLITPVIAHFLQEQGYTVVSAVGRSGGPKLSLNLLDLYQALPPSFLMNNEQLRQTPPPYGWVLHQKDLSPALDAWTERRHQMLKRPVFATMEKVLNPCGASILITSVFHITYMEKMITLADMTGFTGVIVLKRGLEGTLAPSTARASGILCAAKQSDGSWQTKTFDADAEAFSVFRSTADEVVEPLRAADNVSLIHRFAKEGRTGNEDFDKRVNLAKALYQQGLEWIRKNDRW
jgi:anthranilate phosphoribosyltransferase